MLLVHAMYKRLFLLLTSMISLLAWKAAPYWLDKPTNLVLAPDENGRLVCRANGNPKPTIQWLVNGEPIESESTVFPVLTVGIIVHKAVMHTFSALCVTGSLPNPNQQVLGDTIMFHSVQIGSSAVYQCNASNEHGYLLANAFVSILGKNNGVNRSKCSERAYNALIVRC